MTTTSFSTLGLDAALVANLDAMGYQIMTPIQAQGLPPVLEGRDLIAQAETGSGKTAAFGIGLLTRLNLRHFSVQALVLCPTRELADQVGKEIRRLASCMPNVKLLTLCGGVPTGPQLNSLEHGAHIIVGTPGRVLKHLRKGSLKLDQLKILVLDEADRMLDMGFYDDIAEVVAATPTSRQTLLFSATYPEAIQQISASLQRSPARVRVESTHTQTRIEQLFYEVANHGQRLHALVGLLAHYQPESCVVFCNTRQQCEDIADTLQAKGFYVQALHGDLEQRDRDQVLLQFSNRSCSILVATDVAARGLDIKDLPAVINFELSQDPEVHIHRIGRTGRAGKAGLALSLYTAGESHKVIAIEDYQKSPVHHASSADLPAQGNPRPLKPPMVTLCIDGGRKTKLRPGDILGALTGESGIAGSQVGKIDIFDNHAYVAIERSMVDHALRQLSIGKMKGRYFRARRL